jgi:TonB family protein
MHMIDTNFLRRIAAGAALSFALSGAAYADDQAMIDRHYPAEPPVYSAAAQAAGEQGDVVLRIFIMTDGRAHKTRVTRSSGFADLDQAAVTAAESYYYLPTVRGGAVINGWKTLKFHFELPKPADNPPASSGQ